MGLMGGTSTVKVPSSRDFSGWGSQGDTTITLKQPGGLEVAASILWVGCA